MPLVFFTVYMFGIVTGRLNEKENQEKNGQDLSAVASTAAIATTAERQGAVFFKYYSLLHVHDDSSLPRQSYVISQVEHNITSFF